MVYSHILQLSRSEFLQLILRRVRARQGECIRDRTVQLNSSAKGRSGIAHINVYANIAWKFLKDRKSSLSWVTNFSTANSHFHHSV